MKAACGLTAFFALSLFTSTVLAAPSEGEVLFREGRAAMAEKDYERACTKFAESQKREPAPGTALNLGECEEQRGRLIAAFEAFTLAASTFTSADKQRYASGRAEALERRIPRLTVRAADPPPGLVVHVGDSVIPVDTEVKMDPGEVVVRAEAPNRQPNTVTATLKEGKSIEVDVGVLEPLEDESGPGEEKLDRPKKPADDVDLRTVGLIGAGVGAASLAVGVVTGLLTLDRASTVESKCDAQLNCDREGFEAAESGSTLSLVSTITFAAGAVLVIGGGTLYFLSPPAKAASTTGTSVRISPLAARGAGGLVLGGTF